MEHGVDGRGAPTDRTRAPSAGHRVFSALLLTGFAVAMLFPLIFGGKVFHFRDFGWFYAPIKAVCLERMLDGEFPIWLPELNCGMAVHGELVHGLLYPGNVLLLAGETVGWGLFFAFHLAIAGFGARALARHLGATEEGALLSGIAFAGSGYLIAQVNYVPYVTATAWCPVIILLGLRAAAGGRGAVPLLALAFTMVALGGEPLLLLLTIAFLAAIVLTGVVAPRNLRGILSIGVAGVAALLLASPALLPAIETLSVSVRSTGAFTDRAFEEFGCIHPMQLLTFLAPEACGRIPADPLTSFTLFGEQYSLPAFLLPGAYLGAVPLVLLCFAPLRKSPTARLLAVITAISLVLSLGAYLGVSTWVRDYVPGMSVFRFPYKYWLLGTLSVALLAGLATIRGRRSLTACAAVGALLAVLTGLTMGRLGAGLSGMAPFALVVVAAWVPRQYTIRILTVVLAAELLFFGVRQNATETPENLSPEKGIGSSLAPHDPERIFVVFTAPSEDKLRWNAENAVALSRSLRPNCGLPAGFSYSFGYDPPDSSWRHIAFFRTPEGAAPRARSAVIHRLLMIMGTTHSLANRDLSDDPNLIPVGEAEPGIRAYEYREPWSRVRLYGSTRVVGDYLEAQALIRDLDFDPERVLILEGEGESENGGRPVGGAKILEESPRSVRIRTWLKNPAWLFLADTIAPGWKVTVNGEPATLRTANIAFRAVRVPPGTSNVQFHYDPDWLHIAPWSFGTGLLALALLAGWALWWSRSSRGRGRAAP